MAGFVRAIDWCGNRQRPGRSGLRLFGGQFDHEGGEPPAVMILASVIAMEARIKRSWMAVLLITLLGAGSVLAAWAMYDPYKHHPYRIALNKALDWVRSGKDRFDPQYSRSEKECLLKIARIEFSWDDFHEQHWFALRTVSMSLAGEFVRASYGPESSILESRGEIPAETLAAIESELSSLPPSDGPIPLGDAVVILGYLEHGVWMAQDLREISTRASSEEAGRYR